MKVTLLSKIFNPVLRALPKDDKLICKSQKLLLYYGFISPSTFGTYTIMPIMYRSLDKLINIINYEMNCIDAQKLMMPSLGRSSIWKKSGRWTLINDDLFKLVDRESNEICLQPTHEEEVTSLISSFMPLKLKGFPVLFYQITSKFRNEIAPRSGLLRCREFLMKDLYSFDKDRDTAMDTYYRVLQQYKRIFEQLEIENFCVEAHCGGMGGDLSHEFHIKSPIGEDVILQCDKCHMSFNQELQMQSPSKKCINPSCCGNLKPMNAIEIGHCFMLGDRYSEAFQVNALDGNNVKKNVMMGCYGIGVTRLLAACVESLSCQDKIRWPRKIAPFHVAVLLQKSGANDEASNEQKALFLKKLVESLKKVPICPSDVLVDDSDVTIGRKLNNADSIGIPWAIVLKNNDILETVDLYSNQRKHLSIDESIATVSGNKVESLEKDYMKEKYL